MDHRVEGELQLACSKSGVIALEADAGLAQLLQLILVPVRVQHPPRLRHSRSPNRARVRRLGRINRPGMGRMRWMRRMIGMVRMVAIRHRNLQVVGVPDGAAEHCRHWRGFRMNTLVDPGVQVARTFIKVYDINLCAWELTDIRFDR